MSKKPPGVVRVRFEITMDSGMRHEAIFVRREKIEDLMSDPGSLGEFLRDLAVPQVGES